MKYETVIDQSSVRALVGEVTLFSDNLSHWEDAVSRLMGFHDPLLFEFIGQSCQAWAENNDSDPIVLLKEVWQRLRPDSFPNQQVEWKSIRWNGTTVSDCFLRTARVRNDKCCGLVVSEQKQHGWLVDLEKAGLRQSSDIDYESTYFEGQRDDIGYGSYESQTTWRLEKALRQVLEIEYLSSFIGLRDSATHRKLLDVGSGYGFFQSAAESRGWTTQGVEMSTHASTIARTRAVGDVFCGTLEGYAEIANEQFNAITMWDLVEHVNDPETLLYTSKQLLQSDGYLFIRTPNLWAAEFEVFGADYHSLKLEHLHLFSPKSISEVLTRVGLKPRLIMSTSHLLQGFQFIDTHSLASTLRGSDLLVVASH